MIPDTLELHTTLELGMSQHLFGHCIVPHPLWVHAHRFCAGIDPDQTKRKTFLEFLSEIWWVRVVRVEYD